MKRMIRTLSFPLVLSLSLLLAASCSSLDTCTGCDPADGACEACVDDAGCQAEGGTCENCTATEEVSLEVDDAAGAVAPEGCGGCAALMDGGTGWCADCGTGFNAGREVNCKKYCKASPGSAPCPNCVK